MDVTFHLLKVIQDMITKDSFNLVAVKTTCIDRLGDFLEIQFSDRKKPSR